MELLITKVTDITTKKGEEMTILDYVEENGSTGKLFVPRDDFKVQFKDLALDEKMTIAGGKVNVDFDARGRYVRGEVL